MTKQLDCLLSATVIMNLPSRMVTTVSLLFDLNQDFYHLSSVYTGLDELHGKGLIRFRMVAPPPELAELAAMQPSPLLLKVERLGRPAQVIVIDLHDMGALLCPQALPMCDVYFKRSYHAPDLEGVDPAQRRKILPFGMNYASRTTSSFARLLMVAMPGILGQGVAGLRRLRHHQALPTVAELEQSCDNPLDETVVFQTRVWGAHETDGQGEADAVNEPRVALVRALRKQFGDRFRGGLVPTPIALARYPEEISRHSSKRKEYIAMSKRNLVGIYTRGLFHSTAFKLPEYFAASQCIVAEPVRNACPDPLVQGVHYLPFGGVDECLAACDRLLSNPQAALDMRRANHAYYKAHIRPAEHMAELLETAANFS